MPSLQGYLPRTKSNSLQPQHFHVSYTSPSNLHLMGGGGGGGGGGDGGGNHTDGGGQIVSPRHSLTSTTSSSASRSNSIGNGTSRNVPAIPVNQQEMDQLSPLTPTSTSLKAARKPVGGPNQVRGDPSPSLGEKGKRGNGRERGEVRVVILRATLFLSPPEASKCNPIINTMQYSHHDRLCQQCIVK